MRAIAKEGICTRKAIGASSIVIAGLARNCEGVIGRQIEKISQAFDHAKFPQWIIVESDSNDGTAHEARRHCYRYKINLLTLGELADKFPKRTERIAYCGNAYLSEIRTNSDYSDMDYLVVADLDGVNDLLFKESLNACWTTNVDWDGCFPNQLAPYYDIWPAS